MPGEPSSIGSSRIRRLGGDHEARDRGKSVMRRNALPDPVDSWIRQTITQLDSEYDAEALLLMCGESGFLAADDPSALDDAIHRLRGHEDDLTRICALQRRASTAATVEQRAKAVNDLEDLYHDEHEELRDVSYLLGIAVGRRLGNYSLRLPRGYRLPGAGPARLSRGSDWSWTARLHCPRPGTPFMPDISRSNARKAISSTAGREMIAKIAHLFRSSLASMGTWTRRAIA